MKKILHEHGRLQNGQLASVQRFLMSPLSTVRSRPSNEELGIEEDSDTFEDTEKEAGVINWTDESTTAEESGDEAVERKLTKRNHRWLQSALVAATGKADIIVFARAQKIVVLERNDSMDGDYEVIAQFSVKNDFHLHSVYIRTICVLPLAATRKTETRDYDFVAIAVGLTDGNVHFYTERGILLRSENFSHRPIDSVRFGSSVLPGDQEFVVLASGRMTIVDGLSLYAALKAAKIQIARGEEDIQKIATAALLNVEKIRLAKEIDVSDFAVLGPYEQPYAETYAAASVSPNGPKAFVNSLGPPLFTTYMFTGKSPFVVFGWNRVGVLPSNIIPELIYSYGSELVSNMVSSLPNFGIRSFFGVKSEKSLPTQRDQTTPSRAYASRVSTKLEFRSTFEDGGREGERLYPAPSGYGLAAVTDCFARVILFNTKTRQVRRVWKGYRDARCSWIESMSRTEAHIGLCDNLPLCQKRTLFLVLFAPRRGLLEVWSPLNGKRVAAVNVERRGRLISSMRMRDNTLGNLAHVKKTCASAYFFSPDGKIYKIEVPFHFALVHESTAAIRDENILKEMQQISCLEESSLKQFIGLLRTLKTLPTLRRALEMALKNRTIQAQHYSKIFSTIMQNAEQNLKRSMEGLALRRHINVLAHLLIVYEYLHSYCVDGKTLLEENDNGGNLNTKIFSGENLGNQAKRFRLSRSLFDTCSTQLLECLDEKVSSDSVGVSNFQFNDFIECFDVAKAASLCNSTSDALPFPESGLTLTKKSAVLGSFFFSPVLRGVCSLEDFKTHVLEQIALPQLELLDVFCSFWLSSYTNVSFFSLPRALDVCEELANLANNSPKWFSLVEARLNATCETGPAFSLCLIMRAIALNAEKNRREQESIGPVTADAVSNLSSDWEEVELRLERWDVLLQNLQCFAVFKSLPRSPPISLHEFANTGRAYYREKLGFWASSFKPDVAQFSAIVRSSMPESKILELSTENWMVPLSKLISLFPLSMNADYVFCDCAWECINAWKRDPEKDVKALKYALDFVMLLKDSQPLQHNICLLLWETQFKQLFRCLYDWLNKTGKPPKERLARKHIGFGENQLKDFVNCCLVVLRILQKTAGDLEVLLPEVKYEDFVDAFFDFYRGLRKVRQREPLINVLLRQKAAFENLAMHHYNLIAAIYLQLALAIQLQPQKIFDDELAQQALFVPLNKKRQVPIGDVVATVSKRRQDFVEQCIALIAEHHGEESELCELVDDLTHDWALNMDGVALKEMETHLLLGHQAQALNCMYRVRFPELVVQHCYPYLNARMRAYMKEYCPDLVDRARRRGQWARWTRSALKTPSGKNIKLARPPTTSEMIQFVSVLQNFVARMNTSTEDLAIQGQVIEDMANVLKCAS